MAVSCDYTDLQPTDQIGDEMIFSSVSALEQTVTGAYAQMSAKQIIRVTAVLSDDVIKEDKMEEPVMIHISGLIQLLRVNMLISGLKNVM